MVIDNKEMKYRVRGKGFNCAMDVTMNYIGGKWKTVVLAIPQSFARGCGKWRKGLPATGRTAIEVKQKTRGRNDNGIGSRQRMCQS